MFWLKIEKNQKLSNIKRKRLFFEIVFRPECDPTITIFILTPIAIRPHPLSSMPIVYSACITFTSTASYLGTIETKVTTTATTIGVQYMAGVRAAAVAGDGAENGGGGGGAGVNFRRRRARRWDPVTRTVPSGPGSAFGRGCGAHLRRGLRRARPETSGRARGIDNPTGRTRAVRRRCALAPHGCLLATRGPWWQGSTAPATREHGRAFRTEFGRLSKSIFFFFF